MPDKTDPRSSMVVAPHFLTVVRRYAGAACNKWGLRDPNVLEDVYQEALLSALKAVQNYQRTRDVNNKGIAHFVRQFASYGAKRAAREFAEQNQRQRTNTVTE